MFYLTEFFKSLGESLIRGFFFFLFTCLLAFGFTHRAWITDTLSKLTPDKMVNPYFVAVVDSSVTSTKVKAIVAKLPGVLSITEETKKNKSKLNVLLSQLGEGYSIDSELLNFKSLKIVLKPTLSPESLQFVRDQVVKIAGREQITATDVKYPEVTNVMKAHPFYVFIEKAGDWGVLGILALCWVISFWLCYDIFRSRGYIIEKFQRRKLVAAKSLATGLAGVIGLFVAMGILNGTLRILDLMALVMIVSVFWTFSMQFWKWKPTI